jgi:glycosyltransferase involved in cell wall biosynthesis
MVGPGEAGPGRVELHDLVGNQAPDAGLPAKVGRVASYYPRLLAFAARTDARIFHILWFRRLPVVERTLLLAYLRRLGKKLVFTAHNVDDRARDGRMGGFAGRVSLRFLYRTVDHVFVHTSRMKRELVHVFGVPEQRVTVVPLGLNDVIPMSSATRREARKQLGFGPDDRILLFFGNIAPYKGVEDLVRALAMLARDDERLRLVIAGRVRDRSCEVYWRSVEELIAELGLSTHVRKEVRYLPDAEVGLFFRASDVSVLPYRRVYQSGVLGLSYAQGLPVIAADVGSLREDVLEGETGLLHRASDPVDLAGRIQAYFASELYRDLETRCRQISDYGAERFSWATNAERTFAVYESLLWNGSPLGLHTGLRGSA